jgi:hypothetical protein
MDLRREKSTFAAAPRHDSVSTMQLPSRIDPSLLLEIFGQAPIVFNRIYIDIAGSVSAALWLAYAIYHVCEREAEPGSWFSRSQEDWTRETGLSRREQESSRLRLRKLGILEERRQQNAPLAYRLVLKRLYELMELHSRAGNAGSTSEQ